MSNSDGYVGAIAKASPSVINISIKKNIETRSFDRGQLNDLVGSGIIISDDVRKGREALAFVVFLVYCV